MADSLKIRIDGDTKGLEKSLSNIGGIAKKGLGVAVKGIAATGTAIAGLSGLALNAYKDYEQLTGGVETLFKGSAKTVQGYADRAYMTAGISANKYMETVTSFSASLLQSLGGDTQAAAEMSDMALTDMSDNANKMGTNMETIIATYQSLSRGNFAMLDNLKLGYGGTREELERLVKDAAKVDKSVKANDLSFGNLVKAIHAVQTQMGITGTTAKEASTTIEGSVNMMKASWQNLLTGIADDNADFDKLLDNFVDSVVTVGDNLLPRIKTTVKGIGKFVSKASKDIVPEIIDTIIDTAPLLTDSAADVVIAFVKGISDNSSEIAEATVEMGTVLVDGIMDIAPEVVDAAGEIISNFAEEIGKEVPILQPFTTVIGTMAENLDTLIPVLITGATALKGWQVASTVQGSMTGLITTWNAAKDAVTIYTAAQTAYTRGATLTVAGTKALNSGLTVGQTVVGVLTGKIGKATAAQALWNATVKAHPIAAVITAVAALTAGIVALHNWMNKETDAEKAHREAVEENTEAINDRAAAIKNEREALSEDVAGQTAYFDNTKLLADELLRLADSTGKVSDADRGRAEFVLGQLNKALGTEYTLTGNQITRYAELKESIYELIEAKKLEALTNVYKDDYENALKNQKVEQEKLTQQKLLYNDALIKEAELKKKIADKDKELTEAIKEAQDIYNGKKEGSFTEATSNVQKLSEKLTNYKKTLDELYKTNEEGFKAIETAEKNLNSSTQIINGYETAMELMANGNTAEAIKLLEDLALQTGESEIAAQKFAEGSKEALGQIGAEYQNAVVGLINALKAYEEAPSTSTATMVSNALATLQSAESDYIAAGGTLKNGVITGWDGVDFGVDSDMSLLIGELNSYEDTLKKQGDALGVSYTDGYLNSLVDGVEGVIEAAKNIGTASCDSLAEAQESNSPSRKTRSLGLDYGQGYINGILAKQRAVYLAGYALGLKALQGTKDAQNSNSPAKESETLGEYYTEGYAIGIESKEALAINAARNLTEASIEALRKTIDRNDIAISMGINAEEEKSEVQKVMEEYEKIISQSNFEQALSMAKTNEEIQKLKQQEVKGLLESEKEYLAECARIELEKQNAERRNKENEAFKKKEETLRKINEEEKQAAEENKIEKEKIKQKEKNDAELVKQEKQKTEILQKLEKAEYDYSEEITKLHNEKIAEENEKAQDAYLENLKLAAEKERAILEAAYADIEKAQQKMIEETEKAQQKAVDAFSAITEKAIDNIEKLKNIQEAFKTKLKESTSLYYTYSLPTIEINGESVSPTYAGLSDLSKQTEKLERYADNLDKLRERGGVPEEIIDNIREMSVEEGMLYTNALLQANDNDFNKYINEWKKQQETIARIGVNEYSDEFKELENELKEQFGAIPVDFWGVGIESANNFTDAFIKSFEENWRKVKDVVLGTLSTISPQLALGVGGNNGSVVNNTSTYSPVFYVQPSNGESTQQQLRAIRNANLFDMIRQKNK